MRTTKTDRFESKVITTQKKLCAFDKKKPNINKSFGLKRTIPFFLSLSLVTEIYNNT